MDLGLGQEGAGLLDLGGEVGTLVAGPALVESLPHGLLGPEKPSQLRRGRAAGFQEGHEVALAQPGKEILDPLPGGLEPGLPTGEYGHAGRVVQHDRNGPGSSAAPERSQTGERGASETNGDQEQHGHPHNQAATGPPRTSAGESAER